MLLKDTVSYNDIITPTHGQACCHEKKNKKKHLGLFFQFPDEWLL